MHTNPWGKPNPSAYPSVSASSSSVRPPVTPYGMGNPYVVPQFPPVQQPGLRSAAQAYPNIPAVYSQFAAGGSVPGIKPAHQAYPMIPVPSNPGYQPSFVPRPGMFGKGGKGGKGKGGKWGSSGSTANAANAIPLGRERTWGTTPEESNQPDHLPISPVHRPVQVIGRGRALTLPAWAQRAPPGQTVVDISKDEDDRESRRRYRDDEAHRSEGKDRTSDRRSDHRSEGKETVSDRRSDHRSEGKDTVSDRRSDYRSQGRTSDRRSDYRSDRRTPDRSPSRRSRERRRRESPRSTRRRSRSWRR